MNRFILLGSGVLLALTALAEGRDITTKTGETYKNVTINRVEATGISVTHSTGVAFLDCPVLPDQLQREFGCTAERYAAGKVILEQRQRALAEYQANVAAEVAARNLQANLQIAAAMERRASSAIAPISERDYSAPRFAEDRYTAPLYSGGGTVSVRAYTRSDGTYVRAHTRSAPGRGRR